MERHALFMHLGANHTLKTESFPTNVEGEDGDEYEKAGEQ
jgi:hypothetical protein